MSHCPKIRKDLLTRLYHYKHSLIPKKPMTKLVNEAVEEYLDKRIKRKNGVENKNQRRGRLSDGT